MSRTAASASLLDDPFFVAELAKLDLPPTTREISGGVHWQTEPPVAEASDDGESFEDVEETGTASEPHAAALPHFSGPRTAERGMGRTVLAVGGFVVMMLVGAAAAVVMFHDRIALILQNLR